jgi:hypothetical protein
MSGAGVRVGLSQARFGRAGSDPWRTGLGTTGEQVVGLGRGVGEGQCAPDLPAGEPSPPAATEAP